MEPREEYIKRASVWLSHQETCGNEVLELAQQFERVAAPLEAEVERLRKDAERLDWLDSVKERAGQEWWIWSAQYESLTMASKSYVCESGEVQRRSIREAIDAALASEKEPTP